MGETQPGAEPRGSVWPGLELQANRLGLDDLVAAILDDFSPAAIEDLVLPPLPAGGLWDPTFPPLPEPPPAPVHWRAFFTSAERRDAALLALRAGCPDLLLDVFDVSDEDWAARSQQALTAIRAGAFLVAPPWDLPTAAEPGVITIVIEPSRGFGTGHHASTRLCLRALSGMDVAGQRVLDLGTGSGVLAMAADLKGAAGVVAVDVDPDAIDAARESAALNALPVPIDFRVEDYRRAPTHPADLVLANLTGGMLIASAKRIAELVAPGGRIVMSGFDESEQATVRAAFAGMQERASFSEEGWVGLVLSRSRD